MLPPGVPNLGYVLRKNPDASVHVVWYDGKEETTQPWKLRQLIPNYVSESAASEDGDEQHYYSPTDHECDDLEDFRYYDYAALPAEARLKRIGLIVAVMKEVILRLCSLTLTLDNYCPHVDRKKLVKLTLSCNDVCNGFANLSDFREAVKRVFEERPEGDPRGDAHGQQRAAAATVGRERQREHGEGQVHRENADDARADDRREAARGTGHWAFLAH